MYKKPNWNNSSIERNEAIEGETIEEKIQRIVENKEPIKDGSPTIYTERKEGVIDAYNIRTDRFEIACDAMDTVSKTEIGKRMDRMKQAEVIPLNPEGKPAQGTTE